MEYLKLWLSVVIRAALQNAVLLTSILADFFCFSNHNMKNLNTYAKNYKNDYKFRQIAHKHQIINNLDA